MTPLQKFLIPLFGGAGALHFLKPEPFDSIVPPQLPGKARTYTEVSGVAELAAASLIAVPKTRKLGGLFSAALLLGVWPANFYMAWQWRDKSWPLRLGAIARLPLQVPLIKAALGLRRASARG